MRRFIIDKTDDKTSTLIKKNFNPDYNFWDWKIKKVKNKKITTIFGFKKNKNIKHAFESTKVCDITVEETSNDGSPLFVWDVFVKNTLASSYQRITSTNVAMGIKKVTRFMNNSFNG